MTYEELVRGLHAWATRQAAYITGNVIDADDLTANCFMAIFRNPSTILQLDANQQKAYLRRTMIRMWVRELGRRTVEVVEVDQMALQVPEDFDLSESVAGRLYASGELAKLPDYKRLAVVMRCLGYSNAEIADVVRENFAAEAPTSGTVASWWSRGLVKRDPETR